MKIAVDAGCLGIRDERLKVGVYRVAVGLLKELGKIDKENSYYLYSFYPIEEDLMKSFGPHMKNVIVAPSKGWMKIWLPFRLLRQKPDIFLGLSQALPEKVANLPHYRSIVLFHDLAFEKFPTLYTYAGSQQKLHTQSIHAAEKADVIIAVSRNTKRDIVQTYHIPESRIRVAHPGTQAVGIHSSLSDAVSETLPYFLFVGAFKKIKNIPVLLRAFSYFCENSSLPHELVLAGGNRWLDPDITETLASLPDAVQSRIKIKGFVSEDMLASLYKGATAFVSPSIYEGFGLPYLEAMSWGCPVIGSTNGASPEIIGSAGYVVDPSDPVKIGKAMLRIAESADIRDTLRKKGFERVKEFSWGKFAKEVLVSCLHA